MVTIIGVRFKSVGKIYYFDPTGYEVQVGDKVIVETARGMELGQIVIAPREVSEESVTLPLKGIIRMATEEDLMMDAANRQKEKEAFKLCNEKIQKHGLLMKLIEVEYTFDRSKILFYFSAEDRVDFRELVKDLAGIFKTRIELRQIGVRDETKTLGGIGVCGRVLCCHSYLPDFIPVSIKMAKEQNLPLNPTKISGVCGRLMCCLKNEEDTYEWLNKQLPNVGDYVELDDGSRGEVSSLNVLRQKLKVLIDNDGDDKEIREYTAEQVKSVQKGNHRRIESAAERREEREAMALEQADNDKPEERRSHRPERHPYGPGKKPEKLEQAEMADAENQNPGQNQGGRHEGHRYGGHGDHRRQGGDRNGQKPDSKPADNRGGKREHSDRGRANRGNK